METCARIFAAFSKLRNTGSLGANSNRTLRRLCARLTCRKNLESVHPLMSESMKEVELLQMWKEDILGLVDVLKL